MAVRLAFPEYIQDEQNGHWMNIMAVGKGDDTNTPQATVTLFVPGGLNGSNMIWETRHDFMEAKLSKVVQGAASSIPIVGTAMAASAGALRMAGATINPKVEVLYRNTELRVFQFQFIMAPSTRSEAQALRDIVKTLRQYSSPRLIGGRSDPDAGYIGSAGGQASYLSTGGYFEAPSEFLIRFKYRDQNGVWRDNMNVPRIGRCVIESIDINYTPNGDWSTFHDGMPTSAMLTMTFREMRVIDSQNIQDGY